MRSDLEKFNKVLRKVLAVSHEEIQRREKQWKKKRAAKKAARKLERK